MSIFNYLIGDTYGKVTGGRCSGCTVKLGGDKKFGVSTNKSLLFDYLNFVYLFKKDVKVYFKDITSYKVVTSNAISSTIAIEANGERHTLSIQGQQNVSEIIGLIEEKANLKKAD